MKKNGILIAIGMFALFACEQEPSVAISGELKQWHNVVFTMDGPEAHELDTLPNPFLDYEMTVTFSHESGEPVYRVPGYFAADGNAGESSAQSGNKWRAHLSPDKTGQWNYTIAFELKGEPTQWSGASGNFNVEASDKTGRDFRSKGRLQYVNKRYLQFAGSGEYFLKAERMHRNPSWPLRTLMALIRPKMRG